MLVVWPLIVSVHVMPHAGTARFDAIVRADRDFNRLREVAIEIPDEEGVAAVGILIPPLEGAGDALTELPHRRAGKLLPGPSSVEGRG